MENIDLPPTRLDVVQETLRLSQRVAEECVEKNMQLFIMTLALLSLHSRYKPKNHQDMTMYSSV